MYVDDVSFGADCDDEAYELYLKSKQILAEGGFNLRKFSTNSANLQQKIIERETNSPVKKQTNGRPIKEEDKTYTKHLLGGRLEQQDNEQKILGVRWNYV